MRRSIAGWLNQRGLQATGRFASRWYALALWVDRYWDSPWYNLGLEAKKKGSWEESLRYNRRAAELNPKNEAAWWNLGVAATALRNWQEARRAWEAYGIKLLGESGEVAIKAVTACVRLNPNHDGEVVWGDRLDPARFLILNIPLPESGHRFQDIVLNDGAPSGTRVKDGVNFTVFDELDIWQPSSYSTFEAEIDIPGNSSEEQLIEVCRKYQLGVEDWSTMRMLCETCSRGNPGPHSCAAVTTTGMRRSYAFAAKSEESLRDALNEWTAITAGAAFGNLRLVLPAE